MSGRWVPSFTEGIDPTVWESGNEPAFYSGTWSAINSAAPTSSAANDHDTETPTSPCPNTQKLPNLQNVEHSNLLFLLNGINKRKITKFDRVRVFTIMRSLQDALWIVRVTISSMGSRNQTYIVPQSSTQDVLIEVYRGDEVPSFLDEFSRPSLMEVTLRCSHACESAQDLATLVNDEDIRRKEISERQKDPQGQTAKKELPSSMKERLDDWTAKAQRDIFGSFDDDSHIGPETKSNETVSSRDETLGLAQPDELSGKEERPDDEKIVSSEQHKQNPAVQYRHTARCEFFDRTSRR